MANARLYTFEGAVPNGFQLKNTKKHAIQRSGPNPVKKQRRNLSTIWSSFGGGMLFGPWISKRAFNVCVAMPLVSLEDVKQRV